MNIIYYDDYNPPLRIETLDHFDNSEKDPCEVENGICDITPFLESISGSEKGEFQIKVPCTYRGKR